MKLVQYLLIAVLALGLAGCARDLAPNFVARDQVMVDQNTGLVWMKNANRPGKPLIWRGEDNVYYYIQALNEQNFAGYSDWRVPTREEFTLMIDYAKKSGYDPKKIETWPFNRLMTFGFTDVRDYDYWTASRQSAQEIWTADMAKGTLQLKTEAVRYYLWPVRGSIR